MATAVHSNNPFRTPAATPNTTGISAVSSIPSSPPPSFTSSSGPSPTAPLTDLPSTPAPAAAPSTNPNPNPTPSTDTSQSQTPTPHRAPNPDPLGLTEDAPPAYTSAADVHQGESTLEYGPRRPFQQAPPPLQPPQPQSFTPQSTGWSQAQSRLQQRPQGPQSLWQQFTGQLRTELNVLSSTLTGPTYNRYGPTQPSTQWTSYPGQQGPPPPQQQYQQPHLIPQNTGLPPPPPRHPTASSAPSSIHTSEFAADFYAAGSTPDLGLAAQGANPEMASAPPSGPPPSNNHTRNLSNASSRSGYAPPAHPPPSTSSTSLAYAPPPGPPPAVASPTIVVHDDTPPTKPSSSSPAPRSISPSSDFARDFYAAGPATDVVPDASGSRYTPPPPKHHTRNPSASGSSLGYTPPPGPPPAARSAPSNDIPDDGRPTHKPVPGHPLLKDGQLLVYPNGHECDKCHNTGYKHNDPSNPCRKCWSKYAKPFSGALAYTPWTPGSSSSSNRTTFQRPLPVFRAPQSAYAPPGAYQNPAYHTPTPPHPQPQLPYAPSPYAPGPQIHIASPYAPPPPGAAVLPPGHPQLGGRLCWRCNGQGVVSFLVFEDGCEVCGGIGRVFN